MPNFDYIASKEFRTSLESDYLELQSCLEKNAWKSVHVVAGSIVETLLIDYLESTTHPNRPNKPVLKLDLGEAVEICKDEGVISQRTSDLCSVVRSFRNLIHPGRMIRLGEEAPDEASSKVAVALVGMIADELEKYRRKTVGLTAEQLLFKVQRDRNSLSIIKHLIPDVTAQQRERLLLELIPEACETAAVDEFDDSEDRLRACFRMILDTSSEELKIKVAAQFVELVRTGDGDKVLTYGNAFFLASDLESVPENKRAMVKDHLLHRLPTIHDGASLDLIEGIGPYLVKGDVLKWLDPIVKTIGSKTERKSIKDLAASHAKAEVSDTSIEVDKRIFSRLDEWIKHYDVKLKRPDAAQLIRDLKGDLEAQTTPF